MKIAFCLSGQPRFIKECFETYYKPLIFDGNDIDVFMHTWEPDKDQVGQAYENAGGHRIGKPVEEDVIKQYLDIYKPVKYHIEPQRPFQKEKYPDRTMFGIRSEFLFSMFYSIWKANELKKDYEIEKGFKYDWVIRARSDVKLKDKPNFHQDKNIIYTPTGCFDPQGIVDCFGYGSSENMDIYANTYNVIDFIMASSDIQFCGEFLLRVNLDVNGIEFDNQFWHTLYR